MYSSTDVNRTSSFSSCVAVHIPPQNEWHTDVESFPPQGTTTKDCKTPDFDITMSVPEQPVAITIDTHKKNRERKKRKTMFAALNCHTLKCWKAIPEMNDVYR